MTANSQMCSITFSGAALRINPQRLIQRNLDKQA